MTDVSVARQPPPASPEDALRTLYRDHARALLAYAEHFTHDRMAAEDALQETFLRAWRHLPRLLQDDRPARPWLRQVLRRILIDRARAARHRHTRLVDDALLDGEAEGGYDTLLDRQLLAGAMQQLSPPHRDVLMETYYRDLPAERVAAALGVPVGTVRSRLHYALQALRRQLTEVRDGTWLAPRDGRHTAGCAKADVVRARSPIAGRRRRGCVNPMRTAPRSLEAIQEDLRGIPALRAAHRTGPRADLDVQEPHRPPRRPPAGRAPTTP